MKNAGAAALPLGLALLLSSTMARAQGDGPSSPPPPVIRPPAEGPPCRLAEHSGVDDADAATAAQLVCAEVARSGAAPAARYRVAIGKLGGAVILSVALEGETYGSTADTREMRLDSIEQVPGAAPRIALAIVRGAPIEEPDTSPGPTQPPPPPPPPPSLPPARVHFALGLIGQFPPLDRSATPAPGIDSEVHVEVNPFEIVSDFRFGADSSDGSVGIAFVAFSMGARYFVTDGDVSPFIGGGFAWSYLTLSDNVHNDFSGDHTGLGAYGELGVEIARTRHTHLAFGARLDLPFYSLSNDEVGPSVTTSNGGTTTPPSLVIGTMYYAPFSLEIRLTF